MTRGRLLAAAIALVAGVLTYLLVARDSATPEELILRKAVAMADAAERKDLGFIMKQVSERFRTEDGSSRDDVKGLLAGQLFRGEWVRVMTANVDVTMTSAATADFHGTYIFGRSEAKTLKDLAKESVIAAYEITARVERESDGEWRFVSASWATADAASLLAP
ncbi:MAG TPA: hypothetical protein VIG99_05190 [Myxococcaceae bacterium]